MSFGKVFGIFLIVMACLFLISIFSLFINGIKTIGLQNEACKNIGFEKHMDGKCVDDNSYIEVIFNCDNSGFFTTNCKALIKQETSK